MCSPELQLSLQQGSLQALHVICWSNNMSIMLYLTGSGRFGVTELTFVTVGEEVRLGVEVFAVEPVQRNGGVLLHSTRERTHLWAELFIDRTRIQLVFLRLLRKCIIFSSFAREINLFVSPPSSIFFYVLFLLIRAAWWLRPLLVASVIDVTWRVEDWSWSVCAPPYWMGLSTFLCTESMPN